MRLPWKPKIPKVNEAELLEKVDQLQHALTLTIDNIAYWQGTASSGNPYATAEAQINELSKKYEGKADWGNQLTKSLVDTRAAFTLGDGLKATSKNVEESVNELEFFNQLLKLNNLDEEGVQNWAREAELEGRFCCVLSPDEEKQTIKLRFLSYSATKYKVVSDPDDYAKFDKLVYRPSPEKDEITLDADRFVYLRFGGRTNKVNDCPPKLGSVLKEIEAVDKTLTDLRKINHLYASQTPWFDCEDQNTADALKSKIENTSWKIGKALVTSRVKFSFVGASTAGQQALIDEYTTNVKLLSAASGMPVHFLGLPDLMSNRATADNLMEIVNASTTRERRIWIGGFEEICNKATVLYNKSFKKNLNPDAVEIEVPLITAAKLKELVEVWLPIFESQAISHQTFLGHVPNVDAKNELKRIDDEKAKRQPFNVNNILEQGAQANGD